MSDTITDLSIDGIPISETSLDMAIKLKSDSTKGELEDLKLKMEDKKK